MFGGFLISLCFLTAAVGIVWSSADPRGTHKLHSERRNKHDERIDFHRTKKTPKAEQAKDNDNAVNLGNILFDREQLKKYVLDYLKKHHARDPELGTKINREEFTFSHTDKKQSGNHHNRLKPSISSTKPKQKPRMRNDNHEEHSGKKSIHLHLSQTKPTKRTLSRRQTLRRSNQRNHSKHRLSQKFHLPVYYSVNEVNGKENFIFDHPFSYNYKSSKRKSTTRGKKSGHTDGRTGSRRNKIARTQHSLRAQRRENSHSERLVAHSFPRSLTHRSHRGRASHYRGIKRKHNFNDHREGKDGLRREKSKKSQKSNKRDFIAILPPKAVKIEGFDVERVHFHSSHEKRKTVGSKIKRERHIKSRKSLELTPVAKVVAIRKNSNRKHDHSVAKISHKTDHHATKVIKRKELLPQKANKESKKQRRKGYFHKSSKEYKAIRKSLVGPPASESHLHPHKDKKHHHKRKKVIEHKEETSTVQKRQKTVKDKDTNTVKFSPSWKSLDRRKIPSWYDDAKFGIFVHWGLYSVPSFDNEWFWYNWKALKKKKYVDFVEKNYPPGFSYNQFAPMFKAEFFDANQWAKLVARSGARYFVFTSKHHEGFTNWNSSTAWNWNSVDVGPHRNIVDELARAFRNLNDPHIKFGLYYSLLEWFNPRFLKDKANDFKTDEYVQAVLKPQLYDLINTYKPEYLWTDGDSAANASYWRSEEFLTWLFNESPVRDTVVVNDRWGRGCRCRHGGVYTGLDRYNPGKLQKMKWENAMTIDRRSWGFRREANLKDYLSIEELIKQLVSTVSCGGNLLMNVGPASDGTIAPIFQERLAQMGDWLKVNGDAIYKTKPWRAQNDSVNGDVWYTSRGGHVYAIALKWPPSGKLVLGDPIFIPDETKVRILGTENELKWKHGSKQKSGKRKIEIHVPVLPVSELPCLWAWVFKLTDVK
ncbi:uncharacterized protein LOC111345779 [Stylophora pistillata]|uniref:uncharacterized protein LOC111345779 n=1 Tax=Stylophora pistillata TaxID=50429 RepID=UPI000C04710C|nr:uncharacterized protein LOC111345779 [Stylophora pistillata]